MEKNLKYYDSEKKKITDECDNKMTENYEYYQNEKEKIIDDYNNKIEKLQNSFSLKEICNMIIEDYNENYKYITFDEYFKEKCNLIDDFSYREEEIYIYIRENYKFIGDKKEKELLNIDIVKILNEYNDYFGLNNIKCDKIIVENNNFYAIKSNYKMEKR